jgi:endonuclease G, mitochondrial
VPSSPSCSPPCFSLNKNKAVSHLTVERRTQIQSRDLQTTIETVEEETGLNFSALRPFDSLSALESTRHTRFLFSARDIVI